MGNPQNLFLYTRYGLSPGDFFGALLPLTVLSLLGLCAVCLLAFPRQAMAVELPPDEEEPAQPNLLAPLLALFLLALLSVFRVLHYLIPTAAALCYLLFLDRKLASRVDYSLLLTFVCFFVFSGNLGQLPQVQGLLQGLLARDAVLTSVLASQVISNVPAAVLLSRFTENWQGLLVGCNLGGLGTPIASLASLISLKFYAAEGQGLGRYLLLFTLVNLAFLLGFAALA